MNTFALAILSLALIAAVLADPMSTDAKKVKFTKRAKVAKEVEEVREVKEVKEAKATADNHILKMLAESNELSSSADPAVTAQCFSYYLPLLKQVSSYFSSSYEQCVSVANKATSALNANAVANQTSFTNQSQLICNALDACNSEYDDYLDFLNCFASAASFDVTKIYTLSNSAFNAALSFNSESQEIKSQEELCTDDAQSNYVSQSTAVFNELNECFMDGLPAGANATVPTPVASVAPPSSTALPVTSTAAPTTSTTSDYYDYGLEKQ